jgi:hypothetical protein
VNERPPLPIRILKGFGRFWWDFLVGDTPELFVAALVIIGVIALLSERGHFNTVAIIVLPVLAILALASSLLRAVQSTRRKG